MLVKQRDHEQGLAKAKADTEKKTASELVALLYDIAGIPIPNDRYRQPITVRYDSGVEINREGAVALLEKLRKLTGRLPT